MILSDPLYIRSTFPLLVDSLRMACDAHTVVLMSQELRTGVENDFFKLAVPYFRCDWVSYHDRMANDERTAGREE